MKKFLLILAVVAMLLPSCKEIEGSIDALDSYINKLEDETIPTIDEQIAAINVSLDALDTTDKELKGYIDGLQATADNLQEQINATNTKIDEVKAALQGEISTAKAEVLAELEALETELKNELSQINATIETLKAKDAELDQKIADLRSYVDTELGKTTDWVNATFATLEQYNTLVAEVTTIKAQIVAINESIADLETRLTTKINEDIATAVATLNSTIQQKVSEITTAYTNAVKTAKDELTAAYTAAIATAISNLETSLKSWVGEQLENYYTIAEVNAKISALENAMTEGNEALQEELNTLKSQLEAAKAELTEAYKKAIKEAIDTNNGVINGKIAEEVATINSRINNEVATINAKISAIESRLDNIEAKLEDLLARIQSVSYIPTYDDGKATVKYVGTKDSSEVSLDFKVSPKECVAELANVWGNAIKVEAVYTQTRAVSFVDMPVQYFEADEATGVITIVASGKNLSDNFFAGTQSASVALAISDGNNSVTTDYIPMVAQEVTNEIWYTSTDGAVVTPSRTDVFEADIISNTYENGKGKIVFNGDVKKIGEDAFYHCITLYDIYLPTKISIIGDFAFYQCVYLHKIDIPGSVDSIGHQSFTFCTRLQYVTIREGVTTIKSDAFDSQYLRTVTIPNSVTTIGSHAFESQQLKAFYGKYASEDNRCLIVDGVLNSFAPAGLTEYSIPSGVAVVGWSAFAECSDLTSVIIPNSVTKIEQTAFYQCYNLADINIPDGVVEIGNMAFGHCAVTTINIPDSVTKIGDAPFECCHDLISISGKFTTDDNRCLVFENELKAFAPSGLTEYSITDGITTIDYASFCGCSNLKKVTIPESVVSIGRSAFSGCSGMMNIYCKPTTPPAISYSSTLSYECSLPFNDGMKIHVPTAAAEAYKTAEYWSNYADCIEEKEF